MPFRKLGSTDAFVVTDLADAPISVGVVRCAPKVLRDGAELLARATTYAYATFGVQAGGASAGINASPEAKDPAIGQFTDEVTAEVAAGTLRLFPGTGVSASHLAGWGVADADPSLGTRGPVAAAVAFLGGSAGGARAAVAGPTTWLEQLSGPWTAAGGGELVEGGPEAEADVLFVGGRSGVIDHDVAGTVRCRLLVPLTPVPVTAKAYAVLSRAGTVFVPDAVSCAAPLLAVADGVGDGADPVDRVGAVATELRERGVDAWRAMVERAEAFLATWQDTLPYGRPLA